MSATTEYAMEEHTSTPPTLGSMIGDYVTKLRGGDVGALPAVLGFLFLVILFSAMKPNL